MALDVERFEVYLHDLASFAEEVVVADGVPGVKSRVVWAGERAVHALRAVEGELARAWGELVGVRDTVICTSKDRIESR